MKTRFLCLLIAVMFSFSLATPVYAQEAAQQSSLSGTRRQLATIIFAGLGGAILGLSTLSFYGRPQDYMANIAVGFGIGIITGTIYVTYKSATQPGTLYQTGDLSKHENYALNPREQLDLMGPKGSYLLPATPQLGLQFTF